MKLSSFLFTVYAMLCNFSDFFHVHVYSMSVNMDKFKTNRFLAINPGPRKRKRVLLKDGRPVTEPRVKEKGVKARASKVTPLGARLSFSTRLSSGRAPEKAPPQKQLKKMLET